jgi:tetratricopeptide (TPR) repeat protein
MRYPVAFFALLFAACGGISSATAQVAPNRDSAAYYFRRANEIHKYQVYGDKQAIINYTKSIAFDSSQYWAYRNRGDCYQNLKDYALALADYDRTVAIEGAAPASSVRFECIDMCSQLALWSEAAAHCSVLLANPLICADTAEIFWHPTACVDTNSIAWRILWLQRAEARVKLKQYAAARQDYLTYQQRILAELAAQERFLARIPYVMYVSGKYPASRKAKRLPKRLLAEALARQQATIARLKKKSDAVAAKVADLNKLLP